MASRIQRGNLRGVALLVCGLFGIACGLSGCHTGPVRLTKSDRELVSNRLADSLGRSHGSFVEIREAEALISGTVEQVARELSLDDRPWQVLVLGSRDVALVEGLPEHRVVLSRKLLFDLSTDGQLAAAIARGMALSDRSTVFRQLPAAWGRAKDRAYVSAVSAERSRNPAGDLIALIDTGMNAKRSTGILAAMSDPELDFRVDEKTLQRVNRDAINACFKAGYLASDYTSMLRRVLASGERPPSRLVPHAPVTVAQVDASDRLAERLDRRNREPSASQLSASKIRRLQAVLER